MPRTKPVKDKNVLQWIDEMVDEIIDGESNVSHSKKTKSSVSCIHSKKELEHSKAGLCRIKLSKNGMTSVSVSWKHIIIGFSKKSVPLQP